MTVRSAQWTTFYAVFFTLAKILCRGSYPRPNVLLLMRSLWLKEAVCVTDAPPDANSEGFSTGNGLLCPFTCCAGQMALPGLLLAKGQPTPVVQLTGGSFLGSHDRSASSHPSCFGTGWHQPFFGWDKLALSPTSTEARPGKEIRLH